MPKPRKPRTHKTLCGVDLQCAVCHKLFGAPEAFAHPYQKLPCPHCGHVGEFGPFRVEKLTEEEP